MFKNKERALYERLLEERERVIVALADSVDWYRAQSGTYLGSAVPQLAPATVDPLAGMEDQLQEVLREAGYAQPEVLHMGEDEEEIAWQLRAGAIDPETARQAFANLMQHQELPFDPDENL